jgi:hypothetical protein
MKKIYITLYKANWCGYCRKFDPDWKKIQSILKSGDIKNKLDSEQAEVIFDEYEDSANRDVMLKNNISSYPTVKVSIIDGDNKKTFDLESQDRELNKFINSALEPLSASLKNMIKSKLNNPNQNGGYFSHVKPDLKYYHKYLKYKSKYLDLKNKL